MVKLAKIFSTIIILIVSAPVFGSINDPFLDFLLDIKASQHFHKSNDQIYYDDLAAMQEREEIYLQKRNSVTKENAKESDIKYFLFIGYVAYTRKAAATMEAMSADLIPIYRKNTKTVLTAIKTNEFLIESSCYYLGNHFGFEGKNKTQKPDFISQIKSQLSSYLTPTQSKKCLSLIQQ